MALAAREREVDAREDPQPAEGHAQAARGQHHVGHGNSFALARCGANVCGRPGGAHDTTSGAGSALPWPRRRQAVRRLGRMPLRKKATISTSTRPIQKYQ